MLFCFHQRLREYAGLVKPHDFNVIAVPNCKVLYVQHQRLKCFNSESTKTYSISHIVFLASGQQCQSTKRSQHLRTKGAGRGFGNTLSIYFTLEIDFITVYYYYQSSKITILLLHYMEGSCILKGYGSRAQTCGRSQ